MSFLIGWHMFYASGFKQLESGFMQLASGFKQLASGFIQLASGFMQLAVGATNIFIVFLKEKCYIFVLVH